MSRICLLTALFLTCCLLTNLALAETWVDRSGSFRIEAAFVGVEGKDVTLKKSDGSIVRVPIAKLDAESVAQAKRLYAASKRSGAAPAQKPPESGLDQMPSTTTVPSSLGDKPTIQQTLAVVKELGDSADLAVAWDLLPSSHRTDVNELAQLLAQSVDPPTWNAVIDLTTKLQRLVGEQEEFIVNSSILPSSIEKEKLQKMLTVTEPVIKELLACDLAKQPAMKDFDGNAFFQTQYPDLKSRVVALAEVAKTFAPDTWAKLNNEASLELVSVDGTSAVVKVSTVEGDEDQTYRLVGDRWLPADMADGWDAEIAKAKVQLKSLQTPEGKQSLAQTRQMISMGSAILDPLLNAKTQAEFDQAAAGLATMATAMTGF